MSRSRNTNVPRPSPSEAPAIEYIEKMSKHIVNDTQRMVDALDDELDDLNEMGFLLQRDVLEQQQGLLVDAQDRFKDWSRELQCWLGQHNPESRSVSTRYKLSEWGNDIDHLWRGDSGLVGTMRSTEPQYVASSDLEY